MNRFTIGVAALLATLAAPTLPAQEASGRSYEALLALATAWAAIGLSCAAN